jgi:two-component system sensor histidine kinase UhpB
LNTSPQPLSEPSEAEVPGVTQRPESLTVAPEGVDGAVDAANVPTRRVNRSTLLTQVIATNALAIMALIFFCVLVLDVNTGVGARRAELILLMLAIAAALALNVFILRRQFAPLEKLITTMEHIDLAQPGARAVVPGGATEDIAELVDSFNTMISRLEDERHERISAGVKAQENERARVARDLHDEANQALTAVILRLQAASQEAPPELKSEIDEAKRLAGQAMEELLEVVRRLRPTILDLGLRNALSSQVEKFGERSGIEMEFVYDGDGRQRLGGDRELAIYRVVQEALSNIAQHADATHVDVNLTIGPTIVLRVRDNGKGFDASEPTRRFGVSGMRERAQLMHGTLEIDSAPGEGTTLTMELP